MYIDLCSDIILFHKILQSTFAIDRNSANFAMEFLPLGNTFKFFYFLLSVFSTFCYHIFPSSLGKKGIDNNDRLKTKRDAYAWKVQVHV